MAQRKLQDLKNEFQRKSDWQKTLDNVMKELKYAVGNMECGEDLIKKFKHFINEYDAEIFDLDCEIQQQSEKV